MGLNEDREGRDRKFEMIDAFSNVYMRSFCMGVRVVSVDSGVWDRGDFNMWEI